MTRSIQRLRKRCFGLLLTAGVSLLSVGWQPRETLLLEHVGFGDYGEDVRDLRWVPGGKHLSFLYGAVLYTMEVHEN